MAVTPSNAFRADAAVIWRLGAELFTTGDQALLELVKNSYDAEATYVRIEVSGPKVTGGSKAADQRPAPPHRHLPSTTSMASDATGDSSSAPPDAGSDDGPLAPSARPSDAFDAFTEEHGRLRVIDDGYGMTDVDIRRGWLTLSSSLKADVKRAGVPDGTRVPLGDKGLGRLGAQRLGAVIRLRSRPRLAASAPWVEHCLTIDWRQFQSGRLLEDVEADWDVVDDPQMAGEWPLRSAHGTIIEIRGMDLQDLAWTDETILERTLSTIVNPYAGVEKFRLDVTLNGRRIDVQRVAREVRRAALGTWSAAYTADGVVDVKGILRRQWFRTADERRRELLASQLETEDGRRQLADRVQAKLKDVSVDLTKDGRFSFRVRVWPRDLSGFPRGDSGPFHLALDIVSLDFGVVRGLELTVFDRQAEYRRWVRERSGINVYRDGFVVSGGEALLSLGKLFTSGGSFYGLRPGNVLGYIAISARHNSQLQETTSREDFQRNEAFAHFQAVIGLITKEINECLDEAGRAGSDWSKELADRAYGLFGLTKEEVVQEGAAVSHQASAALQAVATAEKYLASIDLRALGPSDDRAHADAVGALEVARRTLEHVNQISPILENLSARISDAQANYEDLLATAGLGLAAEGLAHDITQVMDRLRLRSREARTTLSDENMDVAILLDEVDWAAGALRSQLRHLDPMLRYSRLRRAEVDLGDLVSNLAAFHAERLRPEGILVEARVVSAGSAWISAGRLAQVLDNLVHNSVYWLRREDFDLEGKAPRIDFVVDGSDITVTDNGPGVAEDLGEEAFRQYKTRKHDGRGLGLWLARQLLDLDSGVITLERTPATGRLNTFRISFPSRGAPE
jgi:signal transduction histidine kinase